MTSATRCTRCGRNGSRVKPITLQSLLTPDTVKRISDTPYRFCDNADCDIVYFGENGDTFSKGDLTVRVGVKETDAPRPVCYCFNHTIEEIDEQVQRTGKSTVPDDIKDRMKTACWCETKSPRGGCCLGTVGKYVKLAIAQHGADPEADTAGKTQPDCCSPESSNVAVKDKTQRSGLLAAAGSLISAAAASACCWLPLLLILFGASAGGVSAWFERYRLIFLTLAGVLLALGFYLVYRPASTCAADSTCMTPRPRLRRLNQVMVWIAAVLVIAFAAFPKYAGGLIAAIQSDDKPIEQPIADATITLHIDGMTCEACAITLKQQLEKTPGVETASVDYQSGTAAVVLTAENPATTKALDVAIQQAGYRVVDTE